MRAIQEQLGYRDFFCFIPLLNLIFIIITIIKDFHNLSQES